MLKILPKVLLAKNSLVIATPHYNPCVAKVGGLGQAFAQPSPICAQPSETASLLADSLKYGTTPTNLINTCLIPCLNKKTSGSRDPLEKLVHVKKACAEMEMRIIHTVNQRTEMVWQSG